ncbi:helix-turn-helix transcriptional regulator [Amycolatopsis eburnea]|uniref:ArsR family transcriptional regulator n=1 Tax=Amycolatopsis eburnea TaxID=2267691 RepID=A0A3R9F5E2_9PSEU|nr:helix-turn-helix domain-containing protein [Amycolatopsis eburnea]RSD11806.1 ArsR family transcriptional regulator [Amycolatopsis eburnea]
MRERPLTDATSRAAPGESRARVLDLLRAAAEPLGVQQVAAAANLHANTARFHLDNLVDTGLAERHVEERTQPGRPRMVYRATVQDAGQRSYRLLATMLTTLVAGELPQPRQAAITAGREWGRYLAERPAPFERVDAEEGIRRLSAVLADAGFAPGAVEDDGHPVIPLRHCPFREIAQQHQAVVCSLHLGLMQGVLAEVRAPVDAHRLDPFVEPSLCLAHLAVSSS